MLKSVATSILFQLLFNLLVEVARCEINRISDEFGRKTYGLSKDVSSKEGDLMMIRRIEEEMLLLNKSGDATRDKRALGILLQGFMEALGYTVTPIQLASLPNPSTAAQMPIGAAAPPMGSMPSMSPQKPAMPPPMMMNASTPRQRETLRFTGLLNFGNSENTTHLINHLSQYEQIFHGNRSSPPGGAPMPPPSTGPDINPRLRPPLKEPLFVQIPLPIVPNLPPPQPPSSMPLDHSFHEEIFNKDSSEEYSSSKEDDAQRGTFEEQNDDNHESEEFEYKHDKYDNPENRNYENKEVEGSYEQAKPQDKHVESEYNESYEQPKPKEQNIDKEYKNNKNIENFAVEKKEIHDPREVDEEGPPDGSQFNHATFVDEPNWKEEQDAKIYKLAAEQEARVEALAEENAEREKQKQRKHEEQEEFHRNREKEIDDANEEHDSSYQKKPYYDNDEEEESSEKESYDDTQYRKYDEGENEEKEADHEEKGTQKSEARAQIPNNIVQLKSYQDADFYPATLPISYDRDKSQQGQTLRDSYGASLEKPSGKIDDRVAEYITMFKNPQTGVYDPNRVHEYEHARISFDHSDLIDGFNRIQKEYSSPENKYEEYEIQPSGDDQLEHRSKDDHEDESKDSVITSQGAKSKCSCNKKEKPDVELQGARSSDRSVMQPPPLRTSAESNAGYEPYYSTMNSMYDSLEHDRGIITRLTSYNTPTTVRFNDPIDLLHNHIRTTMSPTVPPERLTTTSFLHETDDKQITAWPAPFDFLYDNSERKNIVYKKPTPIASSPAPFKPTMPNCNQHMMPFGELKDKVKLFRDESSERYESNRDPRKSSSFHGSRKIKPSEQINKRAEYSPNYPTTQATIHDQRKRPPSNERFSNYRPNTKPTTRSPSHSDIITVRSERVRPTKNLRKNRKSQTIRPAVAKNRESTIKPTIKVKYTYPHGKSQTDIVEEETTNYVEKDGILVIPEPTPYRYNEGFEEFTEGPQSNTERVHVKEFRNHIASVKVAELEQLHPEGPIHIFKYTRNL